MMWRRLNAGLWYHWYLHQFTNVLCDNHRQSWSIMDQRDQTLHITASYPARPPAPPSWARASALTCSFSPYLRVTGAARELKVVSFRPKWGQILLSKLKWSRRTRTPTRIRTRTQRMSRAEEREDADCVCSVGMKFTWDINDPKLPQVTLNSQTPVDSRVQIPVRC